MKKAISISLVIIVMVILGLTYMTAQQVPELTPIAAHSEYDNTPDRYLTVTRIKKPWIAPKNYVVKKFIESIPEFEKVDGLLFKSYAFTEDHGHFGGIYLWKDENAAKKWFNSAWHERIRQKYDQTGQITYYRVINTRTLRKITETKGKYYTVISAAKIVFNDAPKGLLRITNALDASGNKVHITLWKSQKYARDYFRKYVTNNLYFVTPVLLNNQN
ncbi:YdhR family protein [Maribacter sp. 2-571]|uniref:YdhR family protein n=1 Tax=Maribacter sp. 2-571 TaxID=3417569 RepID=UPI003D327EAB